MIETLLLATGLFIMALIFHEIGHLKRLQKTHPKATITYDLRGLWTGEEWMYEKLPKKEKRMIYLDGILWGFFPLLALLLHSLLFGTIAIAIYLYGCKTDLKLLWRTL